MAATYLAWEGLVPVLTPAGLHLLIAAAREEAANVTH